MQWIGPAILFGVLLAPMVLIVYLVAVFTRRYSARVRMAAVVLSATLLITPSLAPATIAVIAVPFGYLLIITLVTFQLGELWQLTRVFPTWYAIAFPVTLAISYVAARLRMPNLSLNADVPHAGLRPGSGPPVS
jgi:hypothetical protein